MDRSREPSTVGDGGRASHTPGPWLRGYHDEISVNFPSGGSHFTLLATGRDCPVALVPETDTGGWGRATEECEANAALIAAAPTMLEALQKAEHAIAEFYRYQCGGDGKRGGSYDGKPEREGLWQARANLRAAIALATTPQTRLDNGGGE